MKKNLLLLLFVFTAAVMFAQNAAVRGFVYDKENGEPLPFTNVVLEGTAYGAQTDLNGYYSITKIPAGDYKLMATSVGYDAASTNVSIRDNINVMSFSSSSTLTMKGGMNLDSFKFQSLC